MKDELILCIVLISLVIIITIFALISNKGYGTWETSVGRCNSNTNKCKDGGTLLTEHRCIPNSITGYGCYKDGIMTYDSYFTEEDCNVSCYESEWSKPSFSPCIDNSRFATYNCILKDGVGPSGCTRIINHIANNYDIGYTYSVKVPCFNPRKIIDLPRREVDIYEITDDCSSDLLLEEGLKSDLTTPCRYLPSTYSYLIPIIDGKGLTILNLPGSLQGSRPFLNKFLENGLTDFINREVVSSSFGELDDCTKEDVRRDTSMQIVIIPEDKVTHLKYGSYRARIAAISSHGFHGFLGKEKDKLIWTPAKQSATGKGMKVRDAELFNIKLESLNKTQALLTIKYMTGETVRVKNYETGEYLYINQQAVEIGDVNILGGIKRCDFHKRVYVKSK